MTERLKAIANGDMKDCRDIPYLLKAMQRDRNGMVVALAALFYEACIAKGASERKVPKHILDAIGCLCHVLGISREDLEELQRGPGTPGHLASLIVDKSSFMSDQG